MSEHCPDPAIRPVTDADIPAVREILFAALDAGELRGSTARDLEHLLERVALDAGGTLVSAAGDELVGFFDPEYPLLVVDPRHRRQRHGTQLVERAIAGAREQGRDEVELAPPLGDGPAEAFAASVGFAYRSSLWQLRLGPEIVVPPPSFPVGYDARSFQPGPDDEAYLTLVNVSFEDHPSPMHLSLDIMQYVHARPGFDPSNIAVVPAPDDSGRLVAFCRAHPTDPGGENKAEIGTLGVLPEYRGLGLGRELLRWGIQHLRLRETGDIVPVVEGRNANALRLYERTGFDQQQEWPRWAQMASGPVGDS